MTPLERAARALWQADRTAEPITPSMATPESEDWRAYLPRVRAVLAAIRDEPSEDMLIAAEQKCYLARPDEIPNIWQAMIDAALTEG